MSQPRKQFMIKKKPGQLWHRRSNDDILFVIDVKEDRSVRYLIIRKNMWLGTHTDSCSTADVWEDFAWELVGDGEIEKL